MPEKNDRFSKFRKARYVEEPSGKLAVIHTRILELLTRIDTPDYLHSAVKRRSYITNAGVHLNSLRAVKFDIKNFFPSIQLRHIHNFFLNVFKCSKDVANLLATLCTCDGRLPTGSPISPLLSFFTFKSMFDELEVLSKSRDLEFSLYVDDMVFSGTLINSDFIYQVTKIVSKFELSIHTGKTKKYRLGSAKIITGIAVQNGSMRVVNQRFKFIRLLIAELKITTAPHSRLKLLEKLIGLLGEASQIEARFKPWVNKYKVELKQLRGSVTPPKSAKKAKAKIKTRKLKRLRKYLVHKVQAELKK